VNPILMTKLYERFKTIHSAFNLGQTSFHKFKPWYVRINTIRNTCCCRYHIGYCYYYDTCVYVCVCMYDRYHIGYCYYYDTCIYIYMYIYIYHRHLETLFTTSCVPSQRVLHFIKNIAWMGHALSIVELHY
jgi:hypothetical protein